MNAFSLAYTHFVNCSVSDLILVFLTYTVDLLFLSPGTVAHVASFGTTGLCFFLFFSKCTPLGIGLPLSSSPPELT